MKDITSSEYDGFHDYLPISEEVFHSGLYVTSAGRSTIHPGQSYPPTEHPLLYQFRWNEGRTLPEFSLILITAGNGVFESRETGKIAVAPGSVVLVFPGVWHRYAPGRRTGWTEKWVQFNGEWAHRLWKGGMISPEQPVIDLETVNPVEDQLDQLLTRIHRRPLNNSFLLSLQALRVLTTVMESIPETALESDGKARRDKTSDEVVARALDYIWTRSHSVLSVTDVARYTGVARRTLERRMAATLNRSVLDEIIQCRISRAERLLRETQLPIKTVASLAGFGSAENMRQVFQKVSKIPPGKYRSLPKAL